MNVYYIDWDFVIKMKKPEGVILLKLTLASYSKRMSETPSEILKGWMVVIFEWIKEK